MGFLSQIFTFALTATCMIPVLCRVTFRGGKSQTTARAQGTDSPVPSEGKPSSEIPHTESTRGLSYDSVPVPTSQAYADLLVNTLSPEPHTAPQVSTLEHAHTWLNKTLRSRLRRRRPSRANNIPSSFDFDQIATVQSLNNVREIEKEDLVLLVVGITGTGKSSFIRKLVGDKCSQNISIGHSLRSADQKINALRVTFERQPARLVIVDTPGFDDTPKSDEQTLGVILNWLKTSFMERSRRVNGVLFLHRITDTRIRGSVAKHFRMFRKLCGDNFYDKIMLVTTMWPERNDATAFDECQKQSKKIADEYWQPMIAGGSKSLSFDLSMESGQKIVNELFCTHSPNHLGSTSADPISDSALTLVQGS